MSTCACGCGSAVKGTWKQGHNPKIKGRPFTEEHRRKLSESNRGKHAGDKHPQWGKPLSATQRKALSDANRGNTLSLATRQKISATKLAKGASNQPMAIHLWLGRWYPKTGVCEQCGAGGKTNYASTNGHLYTRNREDYAELCPSCHLKRDYAEGHRFEALSRPRGPRTKQRARP